jgi:hypothetical protein
MGIRSQIYPESTALRVNAGLGEKMRRIVMKMLIVLCGGVLLSVVGCSKGTSPSATRQQLEAFKGDPSKMPPDAQRKMQEAMQRNRS